MPRSSDARATSRETSATGPLAGPHLYTHQAHPHVPQNVNHRARAERAAPAAQAGWRGRFAAFNERLAVFLTAYVGTMWTAYGFSALALCGLLGVLAVLSPSVYTFIAWLSQTFIQLVLLPVIMVGQNVLNRHAELQADEQFHVTLRNFHESEQVARHLYAQDTEILRQAGDIQQMMRLLLALQATQPALPVTGTFSTIPTAITPSSRRGRKPKPLDERPDERPDPTPPAA